MQYNRLKTEAERLNIHADTLRKWVKLGKIPFIPAEGRIILFNPIEVDRYLARSERRPRSHTN
jgi:excisionase family DNA binding protein